MWEEPLVDGKGV